MRRSLLAVALILACCVVFVSAKKTQQATQLKNDYARSESWLCRPGRHDACDIDLATTVILPGKAAVETWANNPKAPIDCFYVYPTVSLDSSPNSDMTAGPEELAVIKAQAARFGSQCRVFAPLYRQVTLTALRSVLAGRAVAIDRNLGYGDVVDAWNYYLQNDNKGRGVVLIGHSQGSMMLTQLIKNEIDGKPVQKQLVSALLIGTSLSVPVGKDVGGAFQSVPLCRSAKQTGCVVSYASFRSNVPPPANSRFGKVTGENMMAACTNPAALGGGSGELHSYLSTRGSGTSSSPVSPESWLKGTTVETPFVSVPGLLTAECVSNEKGSYLAVTVKANKTDSRTDDISGDVITAGQVQADWGLHLIDVNLAMGNLLDIVQSQAKSYKNGKH